jgi:large subunit ribosomal protein L15
MTDETKEQLKLHHLAPAPGSKQAKIRIGRGEGGKRGKTGGRGTKGLKARNTLRPGFEGGQTPLSMRLPKLKGFKNPNKQVYTVINVGVLDQSYPAGATVDPDSLHTMGLVKHKGLVKVLAEGEITKPLTVSVHAVSAAARSKIEAAGGSVSQISR